MIQFLGFLIKMFWEENQTEPDREIVESIPAQLLFPCPKSSYKLQAPSFQAHPDGTQVSAIPAGQSTTATKVLERTTAPSK